MQGGASGDDGAIPQSIPAQLGGKARQASGSAQAQAEQTLADLKKKTNGIIDKAQGALDGFVTGVYDTKRTVVTGLDTAIGAIETPLLALAPILREVANTGMGAVFSVAETIPESVHDQIRSLKDPLVEHVETQVSAIADAAVGAVEGAEEQLRTVKDQVLSTADEQLDGLADKLAEVAATIPEQLDVVIDNVKTQFAEAYEGQPLYDEIQAELDKGLTELKDSAAKLLDTVINGATERIVAVKDEAIAAVDTTFDELFAALKAVPRQVEDCVRGVATKINSAIDETLAKAKQLAEDLLEDLKTRLSAAVDLVSDSVRRIIEDGFALIREARDTIVNSVNKMLETVFSFCQETLEKVSTEVNAIFEESEKAVAEGFDKVNGEIITAVEELGEDLNQELDKTKDKIKGEAEKAGRDLVQKGDEAFSESEQKFIDNNYEEDTSVIPDIRAKGEEAIAEIESSMESAAEQVKTEFQMIADVHGPKFEAQGLKLVVEAKATILKIAMLALKLGPSIVKDVVSKTKEFVSEFKNLGSMIDELINGKGMAYVTGAKDTIMGVVDEIKTSAEDFVGGAKSSIEELITGTRTLFETVVTEVENDVKSTIDGVVTLATDTGTGIEERFTALFENTKEAVEATITETEDAIATFAEEAEQTVLDAIEAAKEIARKLLAALIQKALDEIVRRLERFLRQLEQRYITRIRAAHASLGEKLQRLEGIDASIMGIDTGLQAQIDDIVGKIAQKTAQIEGFREQLAEAVEGTLHTVVEDAPLWEVTGLYGVSEEPVQYMRVWQDPRNAAFPDMESERNQRIPEAHAHRRARPAFLFADRSQQVDSAVEFSTVYFDFDKSIVRDDMQPVVAAMAATLAANEYITKVTIKGFADARGDEAYNKRLGERRARAVRTALMSNGITPRRIELLDVELVSLGEEAATGDHAEDRKVEVVPEFDEAYVEWVADEIWVMDLETVDKITPVIAALEVEVRRLNTQLVKLQQKAVTTLEVVIGKHRYEINDTTGCLMQLYQEFLDSGLEKVEGFATRFTEEFEAIAEEADLAPADLAERYGALREELAGELLTYGEEFRRDIVEDHRIKIEDAVERFEMVKETIAEHISSVGEALASLPEPKEVLDRLKDEVLPEIEQYCTDLLTNLLECYSERLADSAPILGDALEAVIEVIEGRKPLAGAAMDFLKEDLLPRLKEKAEGLLEPIQQKVEANVDTLKKSAEQAKATALEKGKELLGAAEARVGELGGNVQSGVERAAEKAASSLDSGQKKLALEADSKLAAEGKLIEATAGLTSDFKKEMDEVKAAGDQFTEAAAAAGDKMGGTVGLAADAAQETREQMAAAANQIAGSADMGAVMGESTADIKAAQETPVDSVKAAGETALAGMEDAKKAADGAGGGEEGGAGGEGGGDEAGGDEAGGDEAGGDEAGGDEAGGDEAGGDEAAAEEGTEGAAGEDAAAGEEGAEGAAGEDAAVGEPGEEGAAGAGGMDLPEGGDEEGGLEIPEGGDEEGGLEIPDGGDEEGDLEIPDGGDAESGLEIPEGDGSGGLGLPEGGEGSGLGLPGGGDEEGAGLGLPEGGVGLPGAGDGAAAGSDEEGAGGLGLGGIGRPGGGGGSGADAAGAEEGAGGESDGGEEGAEEGAGGQSAGGEEGAGGQSAGGAAAGAAAAGVGGAAAGAAAAGGSDDDEEERPPRWDAATVEKIGYSGKNKAGALVDLDLAPAERGVLTDEFSWLLRTNNERYDGKKPSLTAEDIPADVIEAAVAEARRNRRSSGEEGSAADGGAQGGAAGGSGAAGGAAAAGGASAGAAAGGAAAGGSDDGEEERPPRWDASGVEKIGYGGKDKSGAWVDLSLSPSERGLLTDEFSWLLRTNTERYDNKEESLGLDDIPEDVIEAALVEARKNRVSNGVAPDVGKRDEPEAEEGAGGAAAEEGAAEEGAAEEGAAEEGVAEEGVAEEGAAEEGAAEEGVAEEGVAEEAAAEEGAAADEPDPLDRPPTERDLLREEQAWLDDTNRVRRARNLPLVTRDKIPAAITKRAVARARSKR